jgi:hypothetical protein
VVETPNAPEHESKRKLKLAATIKFPKIEIVGRTEGQLQIGLEIGTKRASRDPLQEPLQVLGEPLRVLLDPGASLEVFAELEGTVQVPILGPIYGGGLIRLQFVIGYDAHTRKRTDEMRLALAAVASVEKEIAKIVTAKFEIRYGYVFVRDVVKGELYPGVLVGMSGEGALKLAGTSRNLVSFKVEVEFIGLVRRVNLETVNIRAEFTLAFEIEVFELVDIEYSLEAEWDVNLPSVAVAGLGLALGLPPGPP